jgi:hypothetical protein
VDQTIQTTVTVEGVFARNEPEVRAIYDRLLEQARLLGPVTEDPKKTSIHLAHRVGFAGVHPRKHFLYLNLRTAQPIDSPRIVTCGQVSANRFHNDVKLSDPSEVDAEIVGWLSDAYTLG